MELYKDSNNTFWLLTIDDGWWFYSTMPPPPKPVTDGVDGANNWCWYGLRGERSLWDHTLLSPSTALEFLVVTGKNIIGMKMITCVDGGRKYRQEVIKLK